MSQSHPLPIELAAHHAAREFDEMVDGSGAIRPHWRALVGALHSMPDGAFAERVARVQRQHRDIAVAYDIDANDDGERRRPSDLLPLLLTAEEWVAIATALVQRARLMERIVADVYGPRRIIRDGLVPPALLHANPRFLRPCAGTEPAGGYVNLYAVDLVRAPDGSWLVAGDRLQAAAGIGFALHNRSVLARIVPELFRSYQLQRIEPFFELWKASLEALAPAPTVQPRIVVLSPGPFNVAYFEHVLVARQLGAMLVEGADLTLRDGRIFVKTLGPLQPVDVILRFMDDDFCDPLELRGQSMIGVAGLLQAVRGRTVAVVNALGAGVAEVPALRPFLPRLCEAFLGETVVMPSVATEWPLSAGSEARSLRPAFRSRRDEQAAFDHGGRMAQGPTLEEARARPELFVGESRPPASVIPVWTPQGLTPRPLSLRVFLIRHEGAWRAMPGGFAQVPHQREGAIAPFQQQPMSKDVWVLAREDDDEPSLHRAAPAPPTIHTPLDELRSRTADDLYWLGRYTERLDGAARLMRSALLRLAVDRFGPGQRQEIDHLARLLVEAKLLDEGTAELMPESGSLLFAISVACSRDRSLAQVFRFIHRIAQSMRDRLSNDMWTVVIDLLRDARERLETPGQTSDQLISGLDNLVSVIAAFGGMASENMTRGRGWRFLDIGRRLERGIYASSVLREVLRGSGHDAESALGLALELCDSAITYRSRYLGAIQPGPVFHVVMADETNPRALAFQLRTLAMHLQELGASFERPSDHRAEQVLADRILALVRFAPLARLDEVPNRDARERLLRILEATRQRLLELSETITRAYFSHVRTPHSVGYGGVRP